MMNSLLESERSVGGDRLIHYPKSWHDFRITIILYKNCYIYDFFSLQIFLKKSTIQPNM